MRFDFQDLPILGPDIEAAADSAIGADGFSAANPGFAHRRFGFRNFQDCSIAGVRLDALDDINHALQRTLWQRGQKSRFADHGFLHQRVAGTHIDAMAARHAARLTDGFAPIPQHPRMRIFPADRKGLVDFNILTGLDATSA